MGSLLSKKADTTLCSHDSGTNDDGAVHRHVKSSKTAPKNASGAKLRAPPTMPSCGNLLCRICLFCLRCRVCLLCLNSVYSAYCHWICNQSTFTYIPASGNSGNSSSSFAPWSTDSDNQVCAPVVKSQFWLLFPTCLTSASQAAGHRY